jgi:2-dehydro-3-deoxyphosphogalactonate aldolase
MTLDEALAETPIVAIVRGVTPEEAPAIAEAVHGAGVRVIEVPMNSPRPLESISRLVETWGDRMVIGGGTLIEAEQVRGVADAAPNTDPSVILSALQLGLEPMPGFATPTEAFMALEAGATRLKLFPAGPLGLAHFKAVKEVLPSEAQVYPVGGVEPESFAEWLGAGAAGFGLGGALYKAGRLPADVAERAAKAVAAIRAARA